MAVRGIGPHRVSAEEGFKRWMVIGRRCGSSSCRPLHHYTRFFSSLVPHALHHQRAGRHSTPSVASARARKPNLLCSSTLSRSTCSQGGAPLAHLTAILPTGPSVPGQQGTQGSCSRCRHRTAVVITWHGAQKPEAQPLRREIRLWQGSRGRCRGHGAWPSLWQRRRHRCVSRAAPPSAPRAAQGAEEHGRGPGVLCAAFDRHHDRQPLHAGRGGAQAERCPGERRKATVGEVARLTSTQVPPPPVEVLACGP